MQVRMFGELSPKELYEILKARSEVFMMEQNIHYLDMDDVDYNAIHIFEMSDGKVTAYLRMYDANDESAYQIGRVLAVRRGQGDGKRLLAAAEDYARSQGKTYLTCDAQMQSKGFYDKVGFITVSDEFTEAGIPHIKMRKRLK